MSARNDIPKETLQFVKEQRKDMALINALNHCHHNDSSIMETSQYNEEMNKAQTIIEQAFYTVIIECGFYGEDSIFQTVNQFYPVRISCKEFFQSIIDEICFDIDSRINVKAKL